MDKLLFIAADFRSKLQAFIKKHPNRLQFIRDCFPTQQCYETCTLLAMHIFETTDIQTLDMVHGYVEDWDGVDTLNHWWLEIDGTILDVTADQYHLHEEQFLSQSIISCKPFLPVYCMKVNVAPHHQIFTIIDREIMNDSYNSFTSEGLMDWKADYALVVNS